METHRLKPCLVSALIAVGVFNMPLAFAQRQTGPVDARIVNTPTEPVPTTVQGTVNVQGGVAAAVTGIVGIDAVANTVRIGGEAVPTFDVDHPARQPFFFGGTPGISFTNASNCGTGVFNFSLDPGDKTRVVTNVSISASVPKGGRVGGHLWVVPDAEAVIAVTFHYQYTTPITERDIYVATHNSPIYLPPNIRLAGILCGNLPSFTDNGHGSYKATGYLLNPTR